jgi:hypothetical protein
VGPTWVHEVGKTMSDHKNITILAETLSKLWFLLFFHLFDPPIRWWVGPALEVKRAEIKWETFSFVFCLYRIYYYPGLNPLNNEKKKTIHFGQDRNPSNKPIRHHVRDPNPSANLYLFTILKIDVLPKFLKRVKCMGDPITCSIVSNRSTNFENTFLGP